MSAILVMEQHNPNRATIDNSDLRGPLLQLDDHRFSISDDEDEMLYTREESIGEDENACFQELCAALKHNHPAETYVFVGTALTDERASELGCSLVLGNNTTVTSMDVPMDHLTPTGDYDALLDFCATNTSLTAVKLGTNVYGETALASATVTTRFLEALSDNVAHPITDLELCHCIISITALMGLQQLKSLQMTQCTFLESPIFVGETVAAASLARLENLECAALPEEYLAAFMSNLSAPQLQQLSIDAHYKTTVATSSTLANFLVRPNQKQLRKLRLFSFHFCYDQFAPFVKCGFGSLQALILEHCIFDTGCTADLERLLASPVCQIQTLSLKGHIEFGDPFVLASVMRRNTSLTHLQMDCLLTHESGSFAVAAFLKSLQTSKLTSLHLGRLCQRLNCHAFCRHLPQITTIKHLSVVFGSSLKPLKQEIVQAFRRNHSLTTIDCRASDGDWLDDQMRRLQRICERNRRLPILVAQPDTLDPFKGLWPQLLVQAMDTGNTGAAFESLHALVGKGMFPDK